MSQVHSSGAANWRTGANKVHLSLFRMGFYRARDCLHFGPLIIYLDTCLFNDRENEGGQRSAELDLKPNRINT